MAFRLAPTNWEHRRTARARRHTRWSVHPPEYRCQSVENGYYCRCYPVLKHPDRVTHSCGEWKPRTENNIETNKKDQTVFCRPGDQAFSTEQSFQWQSGTHIWGGGFSGFSGVLGARWQSLWLSPFGPRPSVVHHSCPEPGTWITLSWGG